MKEYEKPRLQLRPLVNINHHTSLDTGLKENSSGEFPRSVPRRNRNTIYHTKIPRQNNLNYTVNYYRIF